MSYTTPLDGRRLRCSLCPHRCTIGIDRAGICQIRQNHEGELSLPYFGVLSAIASDPIEKKPLYHFHPGTMILSAGFFGCNFHCPFCQNYSISQTKGSGTAFSPEQLVQRAVQSGSIGIAYTYSEPLIHYEYVLECAKLAHQRGILNVIVSNGYLNPEPASELLDHIDAANIDLKSFNNSFYTKEIGGDVESVKAFIEIAAQKTSLEVTTLVIPTKNDTDAEISDIARYISGIDNTIPLHLSCYYPTYKYVIDATNPETVLRLAEVAARHLKHVYPGNVGLRQTNTVCPECGKTLIERRGYQTSVTGIESGICTSCGYDIGIPGT